MTYQPFADVTLADPGPLWGQLLDKQPVHLFEDFEPPFYSLSRYADVESALRDITTFSSEWGQGPRFTPPRGMLSDPPQHTFFRGLVQQAFTPKVVADLEQRITSLSHELLDDLNNPLDFDLHDDYASPLPVIVISELLGVPPEHRTQFKNWSDAQVAAMGAPDPSEYAEPMLALSDYLSAHILTRRRAIERGAPAAEDLTTQLIRARDAEGRQLADDDILGVASQLLVGGNETTTSLITNLVWRLLQVPQRWNRLTKEPALLDTAIEESLRYDPPVLGLFRNTTRDVELHGCVIPSGSKVQLLYAAANRDPRVFDQPDEFLLDRQRGRHLAFGLGVHMCLGAQLARLETRVAISTLIKRWPHLELMSDGERITPFFLWGRRHLPVRRHQEKP